VTRKPEYEFGVDLAPPGSRDYSCAVQYEKLPDGRYQFVRRVLVDPPPEALGFHRCLRCRAFWIALAEPGAFECPLCRRDA
jgi:hypothetical protein